MITMADSREVNSSSTIEENLNLGRKMLEAVNRQDLTLLDDLVVTEYVNPQMMIQSREDFKQILAMQYKGFPDIHRTIEDIIADEENVWIRVTITGTHTGDYRGIAPTGKKFVMEAVPRYNIVNGKIVEGWSVWNTMDLFKQLGVIEYKGFPDEIKRPH
jgi:steroid delta-isomerase-like uncharacterized protein